MQIIKKDVEKIRKGGDKMKKITVILTVVAVSFLCAANSFAATTQAISVKASVPAKGVSLPATPTIIKCSKETVSNPWTECAVNQSQISFGELTNRLANGSGAGCFYSPDWFIVYLYPDAWGGAGYELRQTFTWTAPGLPANSVVFTPVYASAENGNLTMPSGAQLGVAGAATAQNALVYKSEVPGKPVVVRAQYGIPPNPAAGGSKPFPTWEPVPLTQGAGQYTGEVKITISAT